VNRAVSTQGATLASMVVVEHWFEELKTRVRRRAGLPREQPSHRVRRAAVGDRSFTALILLLPLLEAQKSSLSPHAALPFLNERRKYG
jgi:hypothetical protein